MEDRIRRGWQWVRVPHGSEVRLLVAVCTFAVGLPRLPILHDLLPFGAARLPLEPDLVGVLMTILAALLLATCYRGRQSLSGRIVAAVGMVAWGALMLVTASATSFMVDGAMTVALFWEVVTIDVD